MTLFTGSGSLASEYNRQFPCQIVSARSLNDDELNAKLVDSSIVIHNAARIICQNFEEAINDNFLLTKRIIDHVHQINRSIKFIYISSMSLLETEDRYKPIDEMSFYAFSKYLGEIYCLKHDHPCLSVVRFSTLFYQNPDKDGLSKLVYEAVKYKHISIFNSGEAKRDFIPISIAVKYLHKLTMFEPMPRKVNIVSGIPFSFHDVVNILREKIPALQVSNTITEISNKILNEFSKDNIKDIGEITFRLEDSIHEYADALEI